MNDEKSRETKPNLLIKRFKPGAAGGSPPGKIRVMQITHDLAIGGLQQVVVNLCRHIDRERFQVSVLCLRRRGEFASDIQAMGIPVYLLPQKTGTDYLAFLKVARLLRRERIEVIHTHNTQPFVDGTLGGLLAGVKKRIHTDHGRAFPDKRRYMAAEWAMSHFADKVVGVSDHTAANLRVYEHISPGKLVTIENGISGERYVKGIDREAKGRELGISQKGPILGFVGRLSQEKGGTFLLQAMPEISARLPDAALVIAGTGAQEEALKEEARALGMDDRVYFAGPRRDVPELLRLFDLLVLPSLREGLPMVIPEAMAAGCPVLATRVGGIPSAITHGVSGSLVAPAKPDLLAAEAIRLLRDGGRRAVYQKNGRGIFEKHFSAETMAARYEALYLWAGVAMTDDGNIRE